MFRNFELPIHGIVIGLLCALPVVVAPGCQTYSKRKLEPITTEQVIVMSRRGDKPEEIITKIKDSGTIYDLDARDIWELIEKGVDDRVVDYMKQTLEAERERQRQYYYYYPSHHYHWGWGWGYRYPYCW